MRWPWQTEKELLREQVAVLQHTVQDILTYGTATATTDGNPYPTYKDAVTELAKKYAGTADWGNQPAKQIIDVRASFIIGQGVNPVMAVEGSERELAFVNKFIEDNNLDEEVPQDWAKEAEIEGKFLVRLDADPVNGTIKVRYVPYSQVGYEVEVSEQDYADYKGVTYYLSGAKIELKPPQFVFKPFGGRTHNVNETPSRVSTVLRQIEAIDKALVDWRKINRLFGAPTPHFRTETANDAETLAQKLKLITWKIGKMIATNAEFSLVGPSTGGVESIKDEIVTNTQIISGATGIPVFLMGFPELTSNRSTSDNMLESVYASTTKDRRIWIGFYEELFQKVLALANAELQQNFNPLAIGAEIAEASAAKLRELQAVWLPLYVDKAISLETFLSHVPDIDTEEEMKRLEAEEQKRTEAAVAAFGATGTPGAHDEGKPEDNAK